MEYPLPVVTLNQLFFWSIGQSDAVATIGIQNNQFKCTQSTAVSFVMHWENIKVEVEIYR